MIHIGLLNGLYGFNGKKISVYNLALFSNDTYIYPFHLNDYISMRNVKKMVDIIGLAVLVAVNWDVLGAGT